MIYRKKKIIIDFFDVSIIMPFYKRLNDFKRVLPKNAPFFEKNGVEVIIMLDHQKEEKELLKLIIDYPFINFKIIVNRKEHEWRNPCKVLNVGIKHASFEYILVLDPEVELITDIIYQLRYVIYSYPQTYVTGVVAFISHNDNIHKLSNPVWMSYGSIMIAKTDLIKVHGYDENHNDWGGEDDQIRRKLDLIGLKKMELVDAKAVHRENTSDGHRERSSRVDAMPIRHLKSILYPKKAFSSGTNWGKDFDEIIWCWKTNKSYSQLKKYLSQFQESHMISEEEFHCSYEIIILIQTRNESKNIPEVLTHLNDYCDGIILLDDGSVDDSYEKAIGIKLLAKAKKLYKGYFDDLENRNMLLRTASFFKSKWFIFIDADERFDSRFNDIRNYSNKEYTDIYRFQLVDLWDNPDTYRFDMPGKRYEGIATRTRMFRSKGSLQIYADREIHFPAIPYYKNAKVAQLLLLHNGNYDHEIRQRKFKLYSLQDSDERKQGYSYSFLKDKNVILKKLEDLYLEDIQ